MPLPKAISIQLPDDQRRQLHTLDRASSTPQALAFRCRLILRAAQPDQPTNGQIAAEFGCDRHTVGHWRSRFAEAGLTGLQDAPRPGRPRRVSPRGPRQRRGPRQ
jgi:winged helix-turn helix protein